MYQGAENDEEKKILQKVQMSMKSVQYVANIKQVLPTCNYI